MNKQPRLAFGIAVLFVILGIVLAAHETRYAQSACWGHLGCNYFERIPSLAGWLGIIAAILGIVFISSKAKWRKAFRIGFAALASCGVLVWYQLFSPALVFTDAQGKPDSDITVVNAPRA